MYHVNDTKNIITKFLRISKHFFVDLSPHSPLELFLQQTLPGDFMFSPILNLSQHGAYQIIFIVLSLILLMFSAHATPSTHTPKPSLFGATTITLPNGLQVIVVENHRAKIVTHMLWIRAGAADEPESAGGIAHFLEHLMFKGTPKTPPGDYSRRIRAVGGEENAFTSQDYTAYFFTVPRDQLADIMALERDRFLHLAPPKDHVRSERDVVIEERRERTENDVLGPFYEEMNGILFAGTPYADPVIGWKKDIARLNWDQARTFKNTWYVPNNMILVFSGDITPAEATKLAKKYYGDLTPRPVPPRLRPTPPPATAQATLRFDSDKIEQSQVSLAWRVPSYRQNKKAALAFDVMTEALSGGSATPLYQNLVVRDRIATGVHLSYTADAWEETSLQLSATPADGIPPEKLTLSLHTALSDALKSLTDDDIARAILRLQRQAIFARDPVSGPAMAIGAALTTGSTLGDVETWPEQIGAITRQDIQHAATTYLLCTVATETCGTPLTAIVQAVPSSQNAPTSSQLQLPISRAQTGATR